MAVDSRDALLDSVRTQMLTVANVGKVFRFLPHWRSAEEFEKDTEVVLSDGKFHHRFWTIDHTVRSGRFSFGDGAGTNLIGHQFTIIGYIAVKLDTDDEGEASEKVARNLEAAVIAALVNDAPLIPAGAEDRFNSWAEDGEPQTAEPLELRAVGNGVFHVVSIQCILREEVSRA